jgi:purine-binding chemotaxis protein CheW
MSETAVANGGRSWDVLARAAAAREERGETREQRELLALTIAGDAYAVPVERVREIVRARALTPVPRVPPVILGVISLRGEVVEVCDLRQRLGHPPAAPSRTQRIVVLHGDEGQVCGLLVDGVTEVLRVEESDVRPAAESDSELVTGMCRRGDRFVSVLDVERVLDLGVR